MDYSKVEKIVFISDVHGKFDELQKKIDLFNHLDHYSLENTLYLQVGDMGIGFPNCKCPKDFGPNFKFIRGNHDNPDACREHKNYLGEYGYIPELSLFYISGAESPKYDRKLRTVEIDWWPGEQLDKGELVIMANFYEVCHPNIVVSHDCPNRYRRSLFDIYQYSDTSLMLDYIVDSGIPHTWIFGHWHKNIDKYYDNGQNRFCTRVICKEELGHTIINIK